VSAADDDPPNTLNKFLVGALADQVVILNLPLTARRGMGEMPDYPVPAPLTPDEALSLAAWLVAITGRRADFDRLLDAIERT
jgi:hypothetical protein